jgi:hypothetical protein
MLLTREATVERRHPACRYACVRRSTGNCSKRSRGNRLLQPSLRTRLISTPSRSSYYWGNQQPADDHRLRPRQSFFLGAPAEELSGHRGTRSSRSTIDWDSVLSEASCSAFDGPSFERIDAVERWQLASSATAWHGLRATGCRMHYLEPVADWAFRNGSRTAPRRS